MELQKETLISFTDYLQGHGYPSALEVKTIPIYLVDQPVDQPD